MLRLIQQASGVYTFEATDVEVVPYVAPTPEPAPPPPPVVPIFQDNFDYIVPRDTAGAGAIFQQNGWFGCKTAQDGATGARGYIYTVDAIPGHTDPFPAGPRALCIEALPATFNNQCDLWLQFGDADAGPVDTIPADAWIKFWYFINNTPEQPSAQQIQKFLYFTNAGFPSHDYQVLFTLGTGSRDPSWSTVDGSDGSGFIQCEANATFGGHIVTNLNSQNPGFEFRMGQTDITECLRPNRWQEVTLHIDTRTNNGTYEAWIQPTGGVKVKVAEFISGQNGFEWHVPNPGGHRAFRMPTTVGNNAPFCNQWAYMQDLRIAGQEF